MIFLLITFIIFNIYFVNKKKKDFIFSKYLFLIYATSFGLSIVFDLFWPSNNEYDFLALIYLIIFLLLWIIPFDGITSNAVIKMELDRRKAKIFSIYLMCFLIPATLFFSFYGIKTILSPNLESLRLQEDNIAIFPMSTLALILIYMSSYYVIALVLFFISIRDEWGNKFEIALFISSLSFVMLTLCFAGRDGILLWTINYFILYSLFNKVLPDSRKKKWRNTTFVVVGLGISVFLIISIARFSSPFDQNSSLLKPLINYASQQTQNFCDAFYIEMPFFNSLTPALNRFLGLKSTIDYKSLLINRNAFSEYNVFGFFVKSLIWGYGRIGALIVSLAIYLAITCLKKKFLRYNNIFIFFILFLLFQIPMNGVFYYRQGVGGMDFSYIIGILICLLLNQFYKIKQKR